MEFNSKRKVVFISYPKDVKDLRDKVFEACYKFNFHHLNRTKYEFLPFDWEKYVTREAGPRAQAIINEYILKADIFVGILGARFGSKTGAIDINTGLEYESGMQEEFEIALDQKKKNNNFKIVFFFKKIENITINSIQEHEQIGKVLKFKDELKKNKIFFYEIDDKFDISLETYLYLDNKVNEFEKGIKEIEKIKYDHPIEKTLVLEDYLSRTVILYKDSLSPEASFFINTASQDLVKVLEKENRLVLLADAGYGKSTELKRIVSINSKYNSKFYPILISLNLYTDHRIEELLPDYWKEVPEEALLLLLDGFDEIPGENKITAIREIESFSEKYKNSKIIITCRTNFYISQDNIYSGTLKTFIPYILTSLSWEEYNEYITNILGKRSNNFYDAVQKNKTSELLAIPFYLKYLVKDFLTKDKLPDSRNEIFKELIDSSIQFDYEHFRTTSNVDIIANKEIIFRSFGRLALIMEILCRNYITIQEYLSIVPDEKLRENLRQKGIWNNRGDKWQFEHNSFQEYLAAQVLSSIEFNKIKKFISFPQNFTVTIPSWVNTLSFLLNIYKNSLLKNWILKVQPELMIKFEPDRVSNSLKKKIFIRIFNDYKKKKIWIDRDKFNMYELAKFGENKDIILLLLAQINTNTYKTTIGNAINLLANMKIPIEYIKKVRQKLLNIIINYDDRYIKNDAIIALGALKLNTKEIIEKLLEIIGKSDDSWIRYGLYFVIEESEYLNEYIDHFLYGIKFYSDYFSHSSEDTRVSNEFWHLENGLKKANKKESIIKILDYLLGNVLVTQTIGFDRVIPHIMTNTANVYNQVNEELLFEKITDLYLSLHKASYINEARYCIIFFDKTNTRIKAFEKIFGFYGESKSFNLFECLAHISDENCADVIIKKYLEHNITSQEVWYYQWNLQGNLYNQFTDKINKVTNNEFTLKQSRDFNIERKENLKKYINLLFDKNAIIEEINSIFNKENIKVLSEDLLKDLRFNRYEEHQIYNHNILKLLNSILDGEGKTFEAIKDKIDKINWGYYIANEIYILLHNNQKFDLSTAQLKILEEWCKEMLPYVDYKNALKQTGKTTTASQLAIMLNYFLKTYKFKYAKEKLLDMLSFEWYGGGIEYLEEFLTIEEITQRILYNLENKNNNDYELRNYFRFCIKYEIVSSYKYAIKEIFNEERDNDIRKLALELLLKFGIKNYKIFDLLKKNNDSFKWELVDVLVKKNYKIIRYYLLDVLKHNPKEEKIIAANYLMKLQDLEGIRYYTEMLEKDKKFEHAFHQERAISCIKTPRALKYLLRLLNLSFDKDLREDQYDSLYMVIEKVLTNIALTNERNFRKVYNAVIDFIKKYKKNNSKINFLYAYLERLERQFYFSKSQNITLKDALAKVKLIGL